MVFVSVREINHGEWDFFNQGQQWSKERKCVQWEAAAPFWSCLELVVFLVFPRWRVLMFEAVFETHWAPTVGHTATCWTGRRFWEDLFPANDGAASLNCFLCCLFCLVFKCLFFKLAVCVEDLTSCPGRFIIVCLVRGLRGLPISCFMSFVYGFGVILSKKQRNGLFLFSPLLL